MKLSIMGMQPEAETFPQELPTPGANPRWIQQGRVDTFLPHTTPGADHFRAHAAHDRATESLRSGGSAP